MSTFLKITFYGLATLLLACQQPDTSGNSEKESGLHPSAPTTGRNSPSNQSVEKTAGLAAERPESDINAHSLAASVPPKPNPANAAPGKLNSESPSIDAGAAKTQQAAQPETGAETASPAAPDHAAWNRLLQQYVNAKGQVDYRGFVNEVDQLNAYLETLAGKPVQAGWSQAEKMAYWINAYNAFTVKLIVDNYPVSSIRDLHGGNPWDVKWIELGNNTYTLNNIEHDILRPQFNDARIHFAVNCAAASCPPILNRAWTAGRLETLLDQQTRQFINNSNYNNLSPNAVKVSKIFDWYREDFGNLIEYLNQYANTTIKEDATVSYMAYDWALNEQ